MAADGSGKADSEWTWPSQYRVWLRPATGSPYVVVLVRGRRRRHRRTIRVVRINTAISHLECGALLPFQIWENCADVSPDGSLLVFEAIGHQFENSGRWSSLSVWPHASISHAWRYGHYAGGSGYFTRDGTLLLNVERIDHAEPLFDSEVMTEDTRDKPTPCPLGAIGGELGTIPVPYRLRRDGWVEVEGRIAASDDEVRRRESGLLHYVNRPTERHPTLRWYPVQRGRPWRKLDSFALDHDGIIDDQVIDAAWDSAGRLVIVRRCTLEVWTLDDITVGRPRAKFDLTPLIPC